MCLRPYIQQSLGDTAGDNIYKLKEFLRYFQDTSGQKKATQTSASLFISPRANQDTFIQDWAK